MSDQKKSRKFGRNKDWCKVYKTMHKREVNKLRKLKRHIQQFPNDIGGGLRKGLDQLKALGYHLPNSWHINAKAKCWEFQ